MKNKRLRELKRLRYMMSATEFGQVSQGLMSRVDKLEHRLWHEALALVRLNDRNRAMESYRMAIDHAISQYGDGNGSLISGVYHDHFPDYVKESLRIYARLVTQYTDDAVMHWRLAGNQLKTLRREL